MHQNIEFIQAADGIQEYRLLSNDLKVLLVENHIAPVATLLVVYRVGSRNEAVGYTGATHFLEHMLFKGSPKFNKQNGNLVAQVLQKEGAHFNATTWLDRTTYFEMLPSDKLELAMEIESDRMRNAFIADEERQSEMTVVRNELERHESEPHSIMWTNLFANAFIAHPYHHPTIGWHSDVEGMPTERLKQFYDEFYYPNNATLVIVGDIEIEQILTQVNEYFGPIERSPHPIPQMYTSEFPQEGERRFTIRRPGQLGIVNMGFHVPPLEHKDSYALDMLQDILADGVTSRLYQALVEEHLALHTDAFNVQLRDPGLFTISAQITSDAQHKEVEAVIWKVLDEIKQTPPSIKELNKFRNQIKAEFCYGRHGSYQLANTLAEFEAMADWRYLVTYLDYLEKVTIEDVQRVAKKYLDKDNVTIGYFIPEESNKVELNERHSEVCELNPTKAEVKSLEDLTQSQVQRFELSNGVVLLVQENHLDNTVAIRGSFKGGMIFDPADKPGVASLTAMMMNKGTQKYNKLELADQLAEIGSNVFFNCSLEAGAFGCRTLSENLDQSFDLMFEQFKYPTFPPEELEKLKKRHIDRLKQRLDSTDDMAAEKVYQYLYPEHHPHYHYSTDYLIAATERIKLEDIQKFHQEHYGLKNMIIAVVGDVDTEDIIERFETGLKELNPENAAQIIIPEIALNDRSERLLKTVKGKANMSIIMGHQTSLKRASDDYFAAVLANHPLGRSSISSRLGLKVRDELGLTYGIFSYFSQVSLGAGTWIISVSTHPENIDKTIDASLEVVGQYLKEGISEKELADSKSAMIGSYLVGLGTNPDIARRLISIEYHQLGLDYIHQRAEQINQVTQADVNVAMNKYLHPDKLAIGIAGDI